MLVWCSDWPIILYLEDEILCIILDQMFLCMSDSLAAVLLFVKLESQKSELADSRCRMKAFAFDRIYWSVDPTTPNFVTQEMVSWIGLIRIISCGEVCRQFLHWLYVCGVVGSSENSRGLSWFQKICLLFMDSRFSPWFLFTALSLNC